MKLLGVSIFIVSLASFAVAESLPKAGDVGKAPVNTAVKAEASSGQTTTNSNPTRDHAFVIKDELVLAQGNRKFVIPVKDITGVSYSAVNIMSVNVGPSLLTQVPDPPTLVKTKDHLVGIVWTDKSERSGVVLKVGIGEYLGFMTALEGVGIKAVNSDVVRSIK